MYTSWDDDPRLLDPASGYDPALAHRGDYRRVVDRHGRDVARAYAANGIDGLRALGPLLRKRIADARTLYMATVHLRRGGQAPGPDQHRLTDLTRTETWSMCRALAQAIREDTYRPGASRTVQVPKSKPGTFRTITVQNTEDRVVGRAMMLILQPMFERLFSPFSFGFMPRRGRLEALGTALALASLENRWCWVCEDIDAAFDRIPPGRLLTACGHLVPADMIEFVRLIADPGSKRGIRQGSPASPLLANIYFHFNLDRPWHRRPASPPLLRYADDLLLPCVDHAEALDAHQRLARQARDAGTPLKGNAQSAIVRLDQGEVADWLGFRISVQEGRIRIRIAQRAWSTLALRLARAHLVPGSPIRARAIVQGWLRQMGPCYAHEDVQGVVGRVCETAQQLAFDEIPDAEALRADWQLAGARWHILARDQALKLDHRLQVLRGHNRPAAGVITHTGDQHV